jgi:uncharacterized membrane protein
VNTLRIALGMLTLIFAVVTYGAVAVGAIVFALVKVVMG